MTKGDNNTSRQESKKLYKKYGGRFPIVGLEPPAREQRVAILAQEGVAAVHIFLLDKRQCNHECDEVDDECTHNREYGLSAK